MWKELGWLAARLGMPREEGRSTIQLRSYGPGDESAWVRCRALAFLGTAYFDDVLTTKPKPAYERAIEPVALDDSSLVGLIDVSFTGDAATIETIAVDPAQVPLPIASQMEESGRLRR